MQWAAILCLIVAAGAGAGAHTRIRDSSESRMVVPDEPEHVRDRRVALPERAVRAVVPLPVAHARLLTGYGKCRFANARPEPVFR